VISSTRFDIESGKIGWLRKNLIFDEKIEEPDRILIRTFYLRTNFKIYWDGALIYQSSSNGINRSDRSQPSIITIPVPQQLCFKGKHLISVRFSDFYKVTGLNVSRFELIANPHLRIEEIVWWISNSIFLGVILTCLVLGLVLLWGGEKYRSFIFFTLLCINSMIWIGSRISLPYFNLSTDWIGLVFNYNLISYSLFDVFIFIFISYHLGMPNKLYNISLVTTLCIGYVFLFLFNNELCLLIRDYFFLLFLYLIFLIALEVKKKKKGAVLILLGFTVYSVITTFPYFINIRTHILEIASMTFLLLMIVLSIRQSIKEQVKQQHLLERRADRLETDLLKKSIQPHFIINTLASIKSLAKRNPDSAENLINALAEEFRIINKISTETEIPIKQEIELCEQHLEIMGYRWQAKYQLITSGIEDKIKIPPLIFHTLIENGLTHAFKPKEDGIFWVNCIINNGFIEFNIQNNGSLLEKMENKKETVDDGLGLKYVKARLEERYPGKWEMAYGLNDNKWEVTIKIKRYN
jgi:sensor histidine kinase YesM